LQKKVHTLDEENRGLKEALRENQEIIERKNSENINFLRTHTHDLSKYQERLEGLESEKAYIIQTEREKSLREQRNYEQNLERMQTKLRNTWEINASLKKEKEDTLRKRIEIDDEKFFDYRKNLNKVYEDIEVNKFEK
jgi:uncharacterized protein YaiL (DUF2058 family)